MRRETIENIIKMSYETSVPGWDEERGLPIPPEEWMVAISLYAHCCQAGLPEPFISPCGDGSVHLNLYRGPSASRGARMMTIESKAGKLYCSTREDGAERQFLSGVVDTSLELSMCYAKGFLAD